MVTKLTPLGQRRKKVTTIPATVPNVAPIETTQVAPVVQQPKSTLFSLASMLKTPQATTPVRQPSFAGNVNRPAGSVKISDVGETKPKFDADKFASIAGLLAQAIAPGTVQGRLGGAVSAIGTAAVKRKETLAAEELKFQRGAPGRELTQLQIQTARKKLTTEKEPTEFQAFRRSKTQQINPVTGKLFTDAEAVTEFKQLGKAPVKPSLHFVQDDQGKVSVFENGKLIKGSGLGKTVKKPSGIKLVTDNQGNVSVFEGGKLIKGSGKGKTKTRAAGKTPVDIIKKDRIAKRKDVTAQMKEWTKSDEGFDSTPAEKTQQRKQFGTQYDADIQGWQETPLTTGGFGYTKTDGTVVDQFGKKSKEAKIITSQDQFNKLPDGAIYIEDGVWYEKPKTKVRLKRSNTVGE
jgi:hypothetical protein